MTSHGAAHQAVGRAIARGDLVRQPCEECAGEPRWPYLALQPAVAHHDDYSKPLDVRWLCREHHYAFHRARGDYANQGSKSKEAWARRKAEQEAVS